MTKQGTWLEQWERVKRYFMRFERINGGMPVTKNSAHEINFKDEVYAFFVFCHHLKDWIMSDKTVKINQKTVADFVKGNDCLTLCASICSGIKHLKRKSRKLPNVRIGEFGKVSYRIEEGKLKSIAVKFSISRNSEKVDAFELATECMDKWKKFIAQNIEKERTVKRLDRMKH